MFLRNSILIRTAGVVALAVLLLGLLLTPLVQAFSSDEDGPIDDPSLLPDDTGLSGFVIDLYKRHRALYAGFVTLVMAAEGILIGLLTEAIINRSGRRRRWR